MHKLFKTDLLKNLHLFEWSFQSFNAAEKYIFSLLTIARNVQKYIFYELKEKTLPNINRKKMKPNSSLTNEWMPLFTSFPFVDYVNNLGAENYFARWSPGWEFLLWEGRNLSEDRQTDEREKSVDHFFPSTHSPSLRNGLVPHFLACHTKR